MQSGRDIICQSDGWCQSGLIEPRGSGGSSPEALPLEAHVWLAEQCLRQEFGAAACGENGRLMEAVLEGIGWKGCHRSQALSNSQIIHVWYALRHWCGLRGQCRHSTHGVSGITYCWMRVCAPCERGKPFFPFTLVCHTKRRRTADHPGHGCPGTNP